MHTPTRASLQSLFLLALLGWALSLLSSAPAGAQATTLVADEGDWFDPSIWDGGVVPQSSGLVRIQNGGRVELRSDSPLRPASETNTTWGSVVVGPGRFELDGTGWNFNSISVSSADEEAAVVVGGDLGIADDFIVGESFLVNGEAISGMASVAGSLTSPVGDGEVSTVRVGSTLSAARTSRGAVDVGESVSGFTAVLVGLANGSGNNFPIPPPPGGAIAQGRLLIGGDLELTGDVQPPIGFVEETTLNVGVSSNPDVAAEGVLEVEGDLIPGEIFRVGWTEAQSAEGTLLVGGNVHGRPASISVGQIDPAYRSCAPGIEPGCAFMVGTGIAELPVGAPRRAQGEVIVGGDFEFEAIALGLSSPRARFRESRSDPGDFASGTLHVGGDLTSGDANTGVIDLAHGSGAGDYEAELIVDGETSAVVPVINVARYRSTREDAGYARGYANFGRGTIRALDDASFSQFVTVGTVVGTGAAEGRLAFEGEITGFDSVDIGVVRGDGRANGELDLRMGRLSTQDASIGAVLEGGGTARGVLRLDRSRLEVGNVLMFGEGSELSIVLDAQAVPGDPSVVEAGSAVLGGVLEVLFDPGTLEGRYDLITVPSEEDLSGLFTVIRVLGLDPSRVRFGFDERGAGLSSGHSFYARVIPEPGTGLLFALGLGILARRPRVERRLLSVR